MLWVMIAVRYMLIMLGDYEMKATLRDDGTIVISAHTIAESYAIRFLLSKDSGSFEFIVLDSRFPEKELSMKEALS